MKNLVLNFLAIAVSLATTTGVMIHDLRLDKALDSHLSWRIDNQPLKYDASMGSKPHIHPEHIRIGSPRYNQNQNPNPSYPPREQRLKRYVSQNIEPRGRHAFDNHFLPVIS